MGKKEPKRSPTAVHKLQNNALSLNSQLRASTIYQAGWPRVAAFPSELLRREEEEKAEWSTQ